MLYPCKPFANSLNLISKVKIASDNFKCKQNKTRVNLVNFSLTNKLIFSIGFKMNVIREFKKF